MHSNFCITPFRQTLLVSDFISVCFHYVRRVNQYCLILKIPCYWALLNYIISILTRTQFSIIVVNVNFIHISLNYR